MKPALTTKRQFPLIDWFYRSEPQASVSTSSTFAKLPPLYKLSGNFLATELPRDYFAELAGFVVITAVSAWPIFSSIVAVARMMRGY